MKIALLFAGMMTLMAACNTASITELPTRSDPLPTVLPPMKEFTSAQAPAPIARANSDLARDFLELAFEMESGRELSRLTRFQGPITIALANPGAARFESDLTALIRRLKREANLNIRQIETGAIANIVIETLPRKELQKLVPHAACFVVPRVTNWQDFRKNRRSGALDWTTLESRERATVFIPDDVAPQEARDCLHEEIAQALGPLNDIYRLADSVYNDDNINTVLTGFDMLILRIYYHPGLKNGMTQSEVSAALPAVLKGLNPAGETAKSDGLTKTPRLWIDRVETALGPRVSQTKRLLSARKALTFARNEGWHDSRLGFSLFIQGRLSLGVDAETSSDSFARAYALYSDLYGTDDIHTAHVALQLAAFALSTGDSEAALGFINRSLPSVARAENAALLATFLMIKAEALDFEGRKTEAATVRLDSLGWARYGFATDDEIRSRLREIAALRPRSKKDRVG